MLKAGTKVKLHYNNKEIIKTLTEDVELTVIFVDDRPIKIVNGYYIDDEAIPANCVDIIEE